jgi:ferredoxin
MLRKIITIDKEKCDGCGQCVAACQEGAIGLVDGKAKLLRDDYCDGLGNCLPGCPTGAISFEEREAAPYNEAEIKKNTQHKELPCGCPGTSVKSIQIESPAHNEEALSHTVASQLRQWPIQIKLVPVNAPYFEDSNLLIAADCAAYAHGNFHNEFMRNKITLIGCPKLDDCDYSEKLTAILQASNIKSVTVVRIVVPCCSGIENAVKSALQNCGKAIPGQVVVIGPDGKILEERNSI